MINQTLAPVTLFVYMRPKHTRKTLESLIRNELSKESILHVFAEGPKEGASNDELQKIAETRKVISELNWCGEVIVHEAERNKGLANSVIKGVSQIVTQYGKVIVLEDDLIISKGFLKFMNEALLKYEKEEKVMQISGHSFPAEGIAKNNSSFFIPMTTSWGWATWKRAWHKFDFAATGFEELKVSCELRKKFDLEDAYPYSTMLLDQMETKKIDSWAIRWWWAVFKENGLTLFPDKSLVENIGFDIEGTHTKGSNPFPSNSFDKDYFINIYPSIVNEDGFFFEKIKDYLREIGREKEYSEGIFEKFTFVMRVLNKFKHIFNSK